MEGSRKGGKPASCAGMVLYDGSPSFLSITKIEDAGKGRENRKAKKEETKKKKKTGKEKRKRQAKNKRKRMFF